MLPNASLSTRLAALADPTRRAMIERLAQGELSVSELARPFALTQPTITSHLNVLEKAGLLQRRKVAQKRICSLRPEAIAEVAHWLDTIGRQWAARMDRLADYARSQSQPKETD